VKNHNFGLFDRLRVLRLCSYFTGIEYSSVTRVLKVWSDYDYYEYQEVSLLLPPSFSEARIWIRPTETEKSGILSSKTVISKSKSLRNHNYKNSRLRRFWRLHHYGMGTTRLHNGGLPHCGSLQKKEDYIIVDPCKTGALHHYGSPQKYRTTPLQARRRREKKCVFGDVMPRKAPKKGANSAKYLQRCTPNSEILRSIISQCCPPPFREIWSGRGDSSSDTSWSFSCFLEWGSVTWGRLEMLKVMIFEEISISINRSEWSVDPHTLCTCSTHEYYRLREFEGSPTKLRWKNQIFRVKLCPNPRQTVNGRILST